MGFFSNSVGLLPRDQARLALQSLNVAFSISARSVSLSRISTLPPLPIFRLPPSGGRWSSNRYPLIKPSLINYTWFPFSVTLESARRWRLCYKKVWVHAFIIILRSKPISIQKFWVMANGMVFLSDLQTGRSSSSVQVRLLWFWEARNVRRGGGAYGSRHAPSRFSGYLFTTILFRFLIISPVKFYTNRHCLDSR